MTSGPAFIPSQPVATDNSGWGKPSKPLDIKSYQVTNPVIDSFELKIEPEKVPEFKPPSKEFKPTSAQPAKAQEPHEKFFTELAGSEPVKPFLDVFSELKNKEKASGKMDEILKKLVGLVSKCSISPIEKEKNIIYRLFEHTKPALKQLKDAGPTSNDFSKNKRNRDNLQNKRGGYRKDGYDRDRRGGFNRDERPQETEWRAEEDEMVQKLKKQSKKNMEEAKSEKQDFQRVRLWLNQISPDNFDKKSGELRELLIGNAKIMGEPGFDLEEAKKMKIDDEKQKIVVETIFRKA